MCQTRRGSPEAQTTFHCCAPAARRKKSSARAATQPPTMTVGLHHVAAAAAFVMATTSSVVLRANASTSSGCDFTESPPCSDDPVCAGCDLATQDEVNDCVRDTPTDWIGVDDCASQNRLMCCYNQVTGLDCSGNDRWYFEFRCGRNSCSEDNRVCDGGTADETSPAPTTTTPAPTIATLAPSAANAPVTTTTPAPGAASSPTDYASSTDCVSDAGQTCTDEEFCSECLSTILEDALVDCLGAIDFSETCDAQTAYLCCFNEVSGLDCINNDAFWEYFRCPSLAVASGATTCETRTCDGVPAGGGTSPTPAAAPASPAPATADGVETVAPAATTDDATVAPAADAVETVAPSAAADATVAPAEADSMTAAPSAARATQSPVSPSKDIPEPTSTAERAFDITAAPTTAGDAEDTDASGTNGAGLGISRHPVGLVAAGLVAVVAVVGV